MDQKQHKTKLGEKRPPKNREVNQPSKKDKGRVVVPPPVKLYVRTGRGRSGLIAAEKRVELINREKLEVDLELAAINSFGGDGRGDSVKIAKLEQQSIRLSKAYDIAFAEYITWDRFITLGSGKRRRQVHVFGVRLANLDVDPPPFYYQTNFHTFRQYHGSVSEDHSIDSEPDGDPTEEITFVPEGEEDIVYVPVGEVDYDPLPNEWDNPVVEQPAVVAEEVPETWEELGDIAVEVTPVAEEPRRRADSDEKVAEDWVIKGLRPTTWEDLFDKEGTVAKYDMFEGVTGPVCWASPNMDLIAERISAAIRISLYVVDLNTDLRIAFDSLLREEIDARFALEDAIALDLVKNRTVLTVSGRHVVVREKLNPYRYVKREVLRQQAPIYDDDPVSFLPLEASLKLIDNGCENINFVNPNSFFLKGLLTAFVLAGNNSGAVDVEAMKATRIHVTIDPEDIPCLAIYNQARVHFEPRRTLMRIVAPQIFKSFPDFDRLINSSGMWSMCLHGVTNCACARKLLRMSADPKIRTDVFLGGSVSGETLVPTRLLGLRTPGVKGKFTILDVNIPWEATDKPTSLSREIKFSQYGINYQLPDTYALALLKYTNSYTFTQNVDWEDKVYTLHNVARNRYTGIREHVKVPGILDRFFSREQDVLNGYVTAKADVKMVNDATSFYITSLKHAKPGERQADMLTIMARLMKLHPESTTQQRRLALDEAVANVTATVETLPKL
jgi:hypothetical protein